MTANLPVIIDASTVVDMNSERRLRLSARLYLWNDMYSFISLSPSLTVSDYWYDPVNQSVSKSVPFMCLCVWIFIKTLYSHFLV